MSHGLPLVALDKTAVNYKLNSSVCGIYDGILTTEVNAGENISMLRTI